ncbi:MFS transporter [Rhodococcus opacus]|uniref:MFS transporter n=1 Tax=Rhodococcus opacus TaxID=37919 RepID=UPI001C7D3E97|nr:MFS transporter [Rhodococcus opacus]
MAKQTTQQARKVVWATFIGTTVEWYDFYIYAACAALIFGPQFFPSESSTASQLAAFATFAVGFVARPVGGFVAGHFGDRVGRKKMLVLSLIVMGTATVFVGLVPNYQAAGIWAPILLTALRLVQGLGVGAEWGGAVTMAVEFAPPKKKALYGVAPMMGSPAGLMLTNLMLLLLVTTTGDAFVEWGWRIAFLASVVLIGVGLYVRRSVNESPLFELAAENQPQRIPVVDLVRGHKLPLLRTMFIAGVPGILSFLVLTWALSYGTQTVGYSRNELLWVGVGVCGLQLIVLPLLASHADRRGHRAMAVVSAIAMAVAGVMFFPLFDTGNVGLAFVATALASAATMFAWAVVPPILSEAFPVQIRYTGISMAYQLGSVLCGGLAPFIATFLYAETGSAVAVSVYVIGGCLVMLTCILFHRGSHASQTPVTQQSAMDTPTTIPG